MRVQGCNSKVRCSILSAAGCNIKVRFCFLVWQVGNLVKVLFDDEVWYHGTIQEYDAPTDQFTIKFDDGDEQLIKLPDPDVQRVTLMEDLLEATSSMRKSAPPFRMPPATCQHTRRLPRHTSPATCRVNTYDACRVNTYDACRCAQRSARSTHINPPGPDVRP